MPQKKHQPEENVAKLWQVDALLSQGRSVSEAVRTISVTPFTYYRWRKEFGGLKSHQVKRLKEPEKENENERLRKAVSDLTPREADPEGSRLGNLVSPARRRQCIEHAVMKFVVSKRLACRVLGQHRSTQRKMPRGRVDDAALKRTKVVLACAHLDHDPGNNEMSNLKAFANAATCSMTSQSTFGSARITYSKRKALCDLFLGRYE